MEMCDINLDDYLHKSRDIDGLLKWQDAIVQGHGPFLVVSILQQILAGLVYIHSVNEVHRDLSPQNGEDLHYNFTLTLQYSILQSRDCGKLPILVSLPRG